MRCCKAQLRMAARSPAEGLAELLERGLGRKRCLSHYLLWGKGITAMPFCWHQRAFAIWEIATICISTVFFCLCKPELPRESGVGYSCICQATTATGFAWAPTVLSHRKSACWSLERVGQLIATAPPGKPSWMNDSFLVKLEKISGSWYLIGNAAFASFPFWASFPFAWLVWWLQSWWWVRLIPNSCEVPELGGQWQDPVSKPTWLLWRVL